jgi:hypothetical protein
MTRRHPCDTKTRWPLDQPDMAAVQRERGPECLHPAKDSDPNVIRDRSAPQAPAYSPLHMHSPE